eukprot:1377533-Rhodomonas_salina.2
MSEQLKRIGTSARNPIQCAFPAGSDTSPKGAKTKPLFQNFSLQSHVYREYVTTMAIAFQACIWAALHLLADANENPNPNAVFFGMFLPFTGACAYVFRTVAKEWFRHKEGGSVDVVQFGADLSSSMALFLGPMATCLRLLDLNAQVELSLAPYRTSLPPLRGMLHRCSLLHPGCAKL